MISKDKNENIKLIKGILLGELYGKRMKNS
jgi:hypothetical protein